MPNKWFDVDKEGLGKVASARGKAFVVNELMQNSFDENVSEVSVRITPDKKVKGLVDVEVEDDSPLGFLDLSMSHTLYAESPKKANPNKRGRYNFGEKLVLSIAKSARVVSTTGSVIFDANGERRSGRERRGKGTLFSAKIRMKKDELADLLLQAKIVLPPKDVKTTLNGKVIEYRVPDVTFKASLPTIGADAQGFLKTVIQKTTISLYQPIDDQPDSSAWLYEMGIPVMEIDLPWSVDVGQRIPLGMSRESVPEKFLQTLRVEVVNHVHNQIQPEQAAESWVKAATSDRRISKEAITDVFQKRHGDKVVIESPFDRDANIKAGENGYQVLGRGTLSPIEREKVKEYGLVETASMTFGDEGMKKVPMNIIPEKDWKEEYNAVAEYTRQLASKLMGVDLAVVMNNNPTTCDLASYCNGVFRRISFNVALLPPTFWEAVGHNQKQDALILHEFGHEYSEDGHRDEAYYNAVALLGAKIKTLALENPMFFDLWSKR